MRYKINGTYRKQYVTKQNDTFDKIALYFYGSETADVYLIEANPDYADVLVFSAGTLLWLPKLELIETSTLPAWKGGL